MKEIHTHPRSIMTRLISVKDSLYERLSVMKGDRSFSYAIESLIEKCDNALVAQTCKEISDYYKEKK